jgi:hypothetical protein
VIVTGNYGEHGALSLLGEGLPPVHSGHNSTWSFGMPADDRDVTILVGRWAASMPWFGRCEPVARITNDAGMPNQEEGQGVIVCRGRQIPWATIWPDMHHFD